MKLNRKKFMEWRQSTKISLMGKGKFKYVNSTLLASAATDPTYEAWEIQNSLVMSWLLHSMQPEISRTYFLLLTTRDIWTTVNTTYLKVGFTSQFFQIKRQIQKTKQGAFMCNQVF